MREIKFRAWDIHLRKMWDLMIDAGAYAYEKDDKQYEGRYPAYDAFEWSDLYRIMQFTGLKDRNGVDIYEGDIISTGNRVWEVDYGLEVDYPAFDLKWWDGECNGLQYFMLSPEEHIFEVIGNIYENPELLK